MEQAVINIVENAIRHTPKNGQIEMRLKKAKGNIILSVKDTGVGIADKDVPHIWDRFYKADASRNRDKSGTGLGLAIVKEIVEAHGGSAEVNSELGKGTTFTLIIPRKEAK